MRDIDNYSNSSDQRQYLPASWLESLYSPVREHYPFNRYSQYIGHGTTPFLYLLEHNPEAEFVTAKGPAFFRQFSAEFCDQNSDQLSEKITSAAEHFKTNVIDKYDIEYINYSGGFTLATVKDRWNELCTESLPSDEQLAVLLQTLHSFYDVLFNTAGVFAFQATDVNMSVTTHPFDTDEENRYTNRMLIGDYTTQTEKSLLPKNGIIHPEKAPDLLPSRENSKEWIDYFVNFGIELERPFNTNDTPLLDIDALGLGWYATTSMQPSWAAPVALSRAIQIKNRVLEQPDVALTDELITAIWEIMTPSIDLNRGDTTSCRYDGDTSQIVRCKRQDPLKFRQQEIFYLYE